MRLSQWPSHYSHWILDDGIWSLTYDYTQNTEPDSACCDMPVSQLWSCSRVFVLETYQDTWNEFPWNLQRQIAMHYYPREDFAIVVIVAFLAFVLWRKAHNVLSVKGVYDIGSYSHSSCVCRGDWCHGRRATVVAHTRPLQQGGLFWGSKQIFEPLPLASLPTGSPTACLMDLAYSDEWLECLVCYAVLSDDESSTRRKP
jgi:hypothetical protein